jgi:hypothetical protein
MGQFKGIRTTARAHLIITEELRILWVQLRVFLVFFLAGGYDFLHMIRISLISL